MWWMVAAALGAETTSVVGTDFRYTWFYNEDNRQTVGDTAFVQRQRPTWFQTTRASARVAGKWYVGAIVGTDTDFKRLRQVVGQLGVKQVLLEVESGSNPGRIDILNSYQTAEPLQPHPDDVSAGPTHFWFRRATAYWQGQGVGWKALEQMGLKVGVTWMAWGTPSIVGKSTSDYFNNPKVVDQELRRDLWGVAYGLDTFDARLVPSKPLVRCKKKLCVRPTVGSAMVLGVGRMKPSRDAIERLDARHDTDIGQARARHAFAFSGPFNLAVSAFFFGERTRVGVRAGVDGQAMVVGLGSPPGLWYSDDTMSGYGGPFAGATVVF